MTFPKNSEAIPYLTTEQMIEVDRVMMDDLRIDLIQMMENAGRNLAHLARSRFLDGDPRGKKVVVLAGSGGNGGGALVCARRLHNYGARVIACTTKPAEAFAPVPRHQMEILNRMQVPVVSSDQIDSITADDLIVDGIIGYSLKGAPRGEAATMIDWANTQNVPILSLDAPSGVDTTTGEVFNPAIRAEATMTLALPKEGLRSSNIREWVGDLYLADISVPPSLYKGPGLNLEVGPVFYESDIVRLW